MDFELSEDQVALRDAAADLLEDLCPTTRVRGVADTSQHLDDELWTAMSAQGWPGIGRSADKGGLGLGLVEVAVLCEQLGRHLAPVPFAGTVMAHGALVGATAGSAFAGLATTLGDTDVGTWAEQLSSGQATGAVSWSRHIDAIRARLDDAGTWRLQGRSDLVVGGPSADIFVVFAIADDEPAIFAVVPSRSARCILEPAMDRTRGIGYLEADDCAALRLGDTGMADTTLDRSIVAACAEMLGAADVVLAMTVQYAKDRVQFGRPIGAFQAVKHRCADMLVDVEGMRSTTYYAAWAVDAGDPHASEAASAAKIWCSDAARRVMASGMQVHGGIGFTWEHDLHLFLKRSQLDQVTFGSASYHRERIAHTLRARAEAGLPVF